MIASDITTQAAKVFLNDSAQSIWTTTVLLPYLEKANEDLALELEVYEIEVQKEHSITVTVEIGDTELDEYPVDFLIPTRLFERPLGQPGQTWKKVSPVEYIDENLNTANQSDRILQWAFRNNKIYINKPTTDRDVQLDYTRTLTPLTIAGSTVELTASKAYLTSRTAWLAATNGGNSPTKGEQIEPQVGWALDRVLRIYNKNQQDVSVRRRPYRGRRIRIS